MTAISERADSLQLVAAPNAVGLGELYAVETMIRWELRDAADRVGAVVRQLAANSVSTTQRLAPLTIRLCADNRTVSAEIEDTGDAPPPQRSGALLDIAAGFYFPEYGGRVLWAEVPL